MASVTDLCSGIEGSVRKGERVKDMGRERWIEREDQ